MKILLVFLLLFLNIGQVIAQESLENKDDSAPIDFDPAAEGGASAGDIFNLTLESCQIDPEYLQPETQEELKKQGVITRETISQENLTIPSLWWTEQQFGQGKLVQNWLAFTGLKQINLIVNRQLWSNMDYLEQYSFVHHFGTTARDYGYELRVFNPQAQCLAIYWCNYTKEMPQCEIDMQPARRDPFNIF